MSVAHRFDEKIPAGNLSFKEEDATYMAKFLDAKHRLMPYLYQLVRPFLYNTSSIH